MSYAVGWKRKIEKDLKKLPTREQERFVQLVKDLTDKGPIQKKWPNFSSLGNNKYHCHLSYHWIACWKIERDDIIIEIYYVGSRENAPY